MIKLYKFKACWGLPDPSPFCVKVETYLRMVAVPYERVECATMFKAPKKKLPYLTDGGRTIPDSGFILDFLKATFGDTLDGRLSAEERARGHALRRTLEESLYWPMVYATRSTSSVDRTSPPCRYTSGPCRICSAIPRPRSMRWPMDFS